MKVKRSTSFLCLVISFSFFIASVCCVFNLCGVGNLGNIVFGADANISNSTDNSGMSLVLIGCIVSGILLLASVGFVVIDSLKYKKRVSGNVKKDSKPKEVKKDEKVQLETLQQSQPSLVRDEVKPMVEQKEQINEVPQLAVDQDEDDEEYI